MPDNKTPKNTSLDMLPARYYEMFALRMLGVDYQTIATKTGYTYSWVRHVFAKGGALYQFWQDWVAEQKTEKVNESLDMMFAHLPELVKANIIHAKDYNLNGSVLARKIIFDYTLGSPEQKIKLDAKVGVYTFADWVKMKTLEAEEKDKNDRARTETLSEEPC